MELKGLAICTRVRHAPHPYVWMAPASATPTGLGIEAEGLKLPLDKLPSWEEEKTKVFPVVRPRYYRAPRVLMCIGALMPCSSKRTP